ncbi:MAG: hypothetical protein E4G98_02615 [Promethearchaeota archaeon]|nr:MAG: hypothetical protein E4G98_02615 [Candidatus Lokiarchaeota archaeon]
MIENNQLYLIIAKVIELILYVVVFYTLNKKYLGVPYKNRPSIHRFFLLGIGGWILYMFLDTIIYVIAPISIPVTALKGAEFTGYSIEYPSLLIANILRDIAIPGALVMAWVYCAAAVQINNGININERFFFSKEKLFPKKENIKISRGLFYRLIAIVSVISVIILDRIVVHVIDNGQVHVASGWGIVNTIFLLGFFTYATFLMIKQILYLRTTQMEAVYKKRAQNLGWGIITYTAGLYYWGLVGVIFQNLTASDYNTLILIFLFLGHGIWSLSAVFIFLAFRSTDKSTEPKAEMAQ